MNSCLIGFTGFIGSELLKSQNYELKINRANLAELPGRRFEKTICAGLPAEKWIANLKPDEDLRNMITLMQSLEEVSTKHFVLISTVDVYGHPVGCTEDSTEFLGTHPYGKHRLWFENFIRKKFERHLIIRLPALFGNGLKKNVLFDLLNDKSVENINTRSIFQWYPLERLAADIDILLTRGFVGTINLCPEPLPTRELIDTCFNELILAEPTTHESVYDVRSKFAGIFGRSGPYIEDKNSILLKIAAFVRSYEA